MEKAKKKKKIYSIIVIHIAIARKIYSIIVTHIAIARSS